MFTMFFLVKLTIAIVIVCGILSPILVSPHNKLSTLFWKIPNAFWIFLICIYFAIAMAVLIESSEQTRIRRQQYFQQYEVPNETHKNVVIENSIKSKRLVRTVLIFTESSDQLSRATDRVPGLPASPGYVQ